MKMYKSEQIIDQLEKRKGGYFFLKVDAEIVEKFEKKRNTNLSSINKVPIVKINLHHI
jgi:hypothetical protein